MVIVVVGVTCLSTLIKYVDYKNRESEFKTSAQNDVISVNDIRDIASKEYEAIKSSGFDFAVIEDSTQALAIEALFNEEIETYGVYFDRNNYVFMKERYNVRSHILWVTYEDGEVKTDIKNTGNKSAVQFIYEEYGILRSPFYSNWDGTK